MGSSLERTIDPLQQADQAALGDLFRGDKTQHGSAVEE